MVDECVNGALLIGQQGTDSRFCLTHLPGIIGGRTTGLAAVKKSEPHKPNPLDISMTELSLFGRIVQRLRYCILH